MYSVTGGEFDDVARSHVLSTLCSPSCSGFKLSLTVFLPLSPPFYKKNNDALLRTVIISVF